MAEVVLALDIDGVLNRLARPGMWDNLSSIEKLVGYYPEPDELTGKHWWDKDWEGWVEHELTLTPENTPSSPFFRKPQEPRQTKLMLHEAHGPWLLSLAAKGVELAWATTWEEAANELVSPLLGLPTLPLAVKSGLYEPRFREETGSWKANTMRANPLLKEKQVIWLDDDNWGYTAANWDDVEPKREDFNYLETSLGKTYTDERFDSEVAYWRERREDFWHPRNGNHAIVVNSYEGLTESIMKQVEELIEC